MDVKENGLAAHTHHDADVAPIAPLLPVTQSGAQIGEKTTVNRGA
jgi:hypothetical protein